jgi:PqqD family protein of HPr-rel-A system
LTPSRPTLASDLDVNESDDGLVVYQASTDRVHYLNHTAGAILALCDGTRSADEIAHFLADGFGLAEPPLDETLSCLAELGEHGLVW